MFSICHRNCCCGTLGGTEEALGGEDEAKVADGGTDKHFSDNSQPIHCALPMVGIVMDRKGQKWMGKANNGSEVLVLVVFIV